jgi:hypothetical protein
MIFDIEEKNVYPFDVIDVFNNDNRLEGYIYFTPNIKYGSLYITKVNGKKCPQWVWGVPKLHYPFNKDRKYSYPKDISRIELYEKLDGTNILAYSYIDKDLNMYVTYKTRKTAIVSGSGYRDYSSMWKELLVRYPMIPDAVLETGYSLSFELYGRKNKYVILYDFMLDARFLFARTSDGGVIPPSGIDTSKYGFKSADLIKVIDDFDDFVKLYDGEQKDLNSKIFIEKREMEEDIVIGWEGAIWYVVSKENRVMYKCKPDYVMDIHFAAFAGIPRHSIYITCLNAFEDMEVPTVDYIKELLAEEFSEQDIRRKEGSIVRIFNIVWTQLRLRKELADEYRKHSEFDINADKGTVMRYFSTKYPKKQMSNVYNLLMEEFGE